MNLKVLVAFLAFLLTTTSSYASFPVKRQAVTTTTENVVTAEVETSKKADFVAAPAAAGGKSQITAAILCWLVGIVGVHRFYLGYTWQGIVQILTLGGLGIWTLIDLIRIITGSLQPKGGAYDKTF